MGASSLSYMVYVSVVPAAPVPLVRSMRETLVPGSPLGPVLPVSPVSPFSPANAKEKHLRCVRAAGGHLNAGRSRTLVHCGGRSAEPSRRSGIALRASIAGVTLVAFLPLLTLIALGAGVSGITLVAFFTGGGKLHPVHSVVAWHDPLHVFQGHIRAAAICHDIQYHIRGPFVVIAFRCAGHLTKTVLGIDTHLQESCSPG